MAIKRYYAVRIGRKNNVICHSWSECEKLVTGFKGAIYKGFKWLEQAESFLDAPPPKWQKVSEKAPKLLAGSFIAPTDKKDKFGYFKPKYYRKNGVQFADYGKTIGRLCDVDNLYCGESAPF
jgi:viroplasmin and RNaseH domain-containing protein